MGERNSEKKRKSPAWPVIVVVVVVAGVGLWLGGDWIWHLFLRMHGIHR